MTGLFTQFRSASASGAARLIELWAALGDRPRERNMWRKLGIEYQDDGRIEEAMRATERAVALSRDLGDRATEGADLRMVSWMAIKLGNYDEARKMAGQALAIATEIADPTLEAWVRLNLARLQELSGDTAGASRHYERALTLGASDALLIGAIRMSLGFLLLRGGDFDGAQRAFEARLDLARRIVQRDGEALARIGLGDTALARGDRAAARVAYDAAEAVLITTGFVEFRCIASARLGRLDLLDDAVDRAAERFAHVIAMAAEIQSPACEAQGRGGLADVAAQRGDLEQAAADARRGVELTELFRSATAGLDARSFGFPALAPAYERAVDLHMRLASTHEASPEASRALVLNEQALARGLLDALSVEQLERRAAISPTLDAERRRLREDWRARALEHEVAVRRGDAQRKQSLAADMTRLTTNLRDVESRIDAIDPRHASFVRPTPLDATAIQQLLDADTTLVEYALGDARSFAWIVTTDAIRTVTPAPRADIELLARRLHVALAQTPAGLGSVSARQADGTTAAQQAMQQDAVALSELVLRPLASMIATPRVAIVASGALSLVPFSMLPVLSERDGKRVEGLVLSERRGERVEGPWLMGREVLNLPSATVLAALRKLALHRPRARAGIAVFADPVYDTRDPRLVAANNGGVRRSSETPERPGEVRGLELTRLPFSRAEADAILRHAASPTLALTGIEATRERALDRDLAGYRIVHFATHGVVHPDVPNLSGIVLSLTDGRGQPRNGFVLLPDVYEMSLNAELVVLSACQTALGTPLRGEGLIGLMRGFMYAGASRVVASLWRVDDEATAALMSAFYRGMLGEGLPVSAALRAAQLEIRKMRRWNAPYY